MYLHILYLLLQMSATYYNRGFGQRCRIPAIFSETTCVARVGRISCSRSDEHE
ncbi:unnamed protein product [Musa hybrid cultivar]